MGTDAEARESGTKGYLPRGRVMTSRADLVIFSWGVNNPLDTTLNQDLFLTASEKKNYQFPTLFHIGGYLMIYQQGPRMQIGVFPALFLRFNTIYHDNGCPF